jgi:hypothetical protein
MMAGLAALVQWNMQQIRIFKSGGCDFVTDCGRRGGPVTTLWTPEADHATLRLVMTNTASAPTGLWFAKIMPFATLFSDTVTGERSLVIADECHQVQCTLDVAFNCAAKTGVLFQIEAGATLSAQLAAMTQLDNLVKYGHMQRMPVARIDRHLLQLRALDARQAGLSLRAIAALLFPNRLATEGWPGPSDSLRSMIRRLVDNATRMSENGYRDLLP